MNSLKKAAASLAAMSIVLAPVAASAAPATGSARASSVAEGQNELEGANWLAIVLGLAIIAGGIWLAVEGDDDPVSP
jgi:tellurite resistance protein TehA-like permease